MLWLVWMSLLSQAFGDTNSPAVLLRLDDNGMNHSVNMAIQQVAETGIPFSTSVMFTCPWYQEAVTVLKKFPHISVGIHLVLNSEWKHYRWGPVLGQTAVPSIVDPDGYFYASTEEFLNSKYKLQEVERELDAQIQRCMKSGLKIDYLDYHMWTAISTPQLRSIVEKLARKYKLGIARYFGEAYVSLFDVPPETKKENFFQLLSKADVNKTNLVVLHVAQDTPEMRALIDMNNPLMHSETQPIVAMHRSKELEVLLSKEFKQQVRSGRITFVTYRDLIRKIPLDSMRAPTD